MRELRLFDPERRPPNWMGHIREGEFALFFKDVSSGQEMKADGTYVQAPEESTCLVAASLDEALDFAQARVDASPQLRCDIFDHQGKANPPLASIVRVGPAMAPGGHCQVTSTVRFFWQGSSIERR